jgi:hypothetical protein
MTYMSFLITSFVSYPKPSYHNLDLHKFLTVSTTIYWIYNTTTKQNNFLPSGNQITLNEIIFKISIHASV